jgi:putative SOS response-associated peptidase YedK
MPAILLEEHHDGWTGKAGKEILVPVPADRMKAWPINARVNSPKNNDPDIIVPIELESVARQENLSQLL